MKTSWSVHVMVERRTVIVMPRCATSKLPIWSEDSTNKAILACLLALCFPSTAGGHSCLQLAVFRISVTSKEAGETTGYIAAFSTPCPGAQLQGTRLQSCNKRRPKSEAFSRHEPDCPAGGCKTAGVNYAPRSRPSMSKIRWVTGCTDGGWHEDVAIALQPRSLPRAELRQGALCAHARYDDKMGVASGTRRSGGR